jgi:hypothetical protein
MNTQDKTPRRKPMYENAMAKAVGMMATCNSCDRIIYEDENWLQGYQDSIGYCKECAAETNEQTPPVRIDKEVLNSGNWFENEWRKLEQKGYNPAAMEEMYKALNNLVEIHCQLHPKARLTTEIRNAKTALLNSKL